MKTKELNKRVREIVGGVYATYKDKEMERPNVWEGVARSIFNHAGVSEYCMEQNLARTGHERKTTFMSDLSIGEYYGLAELLDTVKRCVLNWADNEVYMAEFVLCLNYKCWEHHGRNNMTWSAVYHDLFYAVQSLVYDHYEGDEKKTAYVWEYLD